MFENLNYNLYCKKSLEYRRSNITKTYLALRARTQVRNTIETTFGNETIVSRARPTLGDDVALDLGMFLLGWTSIALEVALARKICFRFNIFSARIKDLTDYVSSVIKVSWLPFKNSRSASTCRLHD